MANVPALIKGHRETFFGLCRPQRTMALLTLTALLARSNTTSLSTTPLLWTDNSMTESLNSLFNQKRALDEAVTPEAMNQPYRYLDRG